MLAQFETTRRKERRSVVTTPADPATVAAHVDFFDDTPSRVMRILQSQEAFHF